MQKKKSFSLALRTWWITPATKSDRFLAFISGLWGGFIFVAFFKVFTLKEGTSISFTNLIQDSAMIAIACAFIGIFRPKIITLIFFPFTFLSCST